MLEYENRLTQAVQGLLEEQGMTGHFARWEGLVKSHGSHSKASQLLDEIEYDIGVNWCRDETVKYNQMFEVRVNRHAAKCQ